MGDVTENFSREEFACKCGCGFTSIHIGLVHRLQLVRDMTRVPLKVLSGCRCSKHNEKEGGKPESYHLKGLATDWCLSGDDPNTLLEKLCTKLIDNWSGGFHYYPEQRFCHCDVGPRRRW